MSGLKSKIVKPPIVLDGTLASFSPRIWDTPDGNPHVTNILLASDRNGGFTTFVSNCQVSVSQQGIKSSIRLARRKHPSTFYLNICYASWRALAEWRLHGLAIQNHYELSTSYPLIPKYYHSLISSDQSRQQLHFEQGILNKFCWANGQLNKKLFNKCLIPQRCNWTNGKLPNFWFNSSQLNKLFNYTTSYPYLKSPQRGTRATEFLPGSYPFPKSPRSRTHATVFPPDSYPHPTSW